MRYRTLLSIFVLISCMQAGRAQIITASQDPARIRWNQIRTASYKFIYPEGYDSLAVSCARLYESFSIPVSATSGFTPARIPVVLHPANASTDYGMTLLPARIDMPVLPQGHLQFSLPVTEMAAVYLSRRAAHLQYGQSNVFRPFRQVFGELVPLAAMERAAALDMPCIFAIGNAPTALVSLKSLMDAGKLSPALIVAVPVGFVNVVESKELLCSMAGEHIVAMGRKGGSNIAATICNALLYMASNNERE